MMTYTQIIFDIHPNAVIQRINANIRQIFGANQKRR